MAENTEGLLQELRDKHDPTKKVNMFSVALKDKPAEPITPSFETYSMDTQDMAYSTLSDGSKVSMFPNYLPGTDNNERLAQQQSTGEKWSNGLQKFAAKTSNAIIGGTLGTVYGLGSAIEQGSFSALYDNDFSNTLADLDSKMQFTLANRYTKDEQEKGLFGQAGTANFWADKVLGGLSFTIGAIASEGIWAAATGGSSLALTGAKWGTKFLGLTKVAKGLNTYKGWVKPAIKQAFKAGKIDKTLAIRLGQAGDVANLARFTLTSAGYESGVEALHFKREQQENFYSNFQSLNGRVPTTEEVQEFESDLDSSANAVFATNMAIVGSSNLVQFGNIFNVKNPFKTGLSEVINKKAFGIGAEVVEQGGKKSAQLLKATRGQKVLKNLYFYGRSPITEGLYEEGLQGVTTKTASAWMEAGYNPEATQDTAELIGSFYESLAEQYGTKEGWVENGVGMIIGALGGSISARSQMKGLESEAVYRTAGADTYQAKKIAENILLANRLNTFGTEKRTAQQKGDIVRESLANNAMILSQMNFKTQLGEDALDLVQENADALDVMTVEDFKAQGIAENEIEDYKKEAITQYAEVARQYKKNRKFAEYTIGRGTLTGQAEVLKEGREDLGTNTKESLVQALTYSLTMGENSSILMKDIQDNIGTEVGTENSRILEVISDLETLSRTQKNMVQNTSRQIKRLTANRDKLQKQLVELQQAPKEVEGDRAQGSKYAPLSQKIMDLDVQLENLRTELTNVSEVLNKSKEYQQGLGGVSLSTTPITFEDLLNIEENVTKFDNLLEGLATVNPQRKKIVQDLIEEYKTAQKTFLDYQNTAIALSSGNVKIKESNNWFSKMLASKKSMDEFTKDWLVDALQNYTAMKSKTGAQEATEILDTNQTEEVTPIDPTLSQPQINLVVDTKTPLEKLVQRLEEALKGVYAPITYEGETYDDLMNKKPTQAEIEEYRTLNKETEPNSLFSERLNYLREKLGNWKLLDSLEVVEATSIADILDLIKQHEQEIEVQDTKEEHTKEDIPLTQSEVGESGDMYVPDLLMNVVAGVKVKAPKGQNTYRFSHLKMNGIVGRLITSDNPPLIDGKVATFEEIENMPLGKILTISGINFKLVESGAIEIDKDDFRSIQQALNLYIPNVGVTDWSYLDVFEYNGSAWIKVPSEFAEPTLDSQALYDLKVGDKVSFQVGNEDGYNLDLYNKWQEAQQRLQNSQAKDTTKLQKEEKQARTNFEGQIKIFAVDSKGRRVSTLKASRGQATDENFLALRKRAVEMFNTTQDSIDLGVSTTVTNLYLGSPQLNIENDTVTNLPITERAIKEGIVVGTGFIENGVVTTNKEFANPIDTTFIGKVSKNNKDKKVPFVILKKGAYNLAYPVSMVKSSTPQTDVFDSILSNQDSAQEKVKQINEAIQTFAINTPKLVFEDLENTDILEATRTAFAEKQTFVSASELASLTDLNTLTEIAEININVEEIENAISDAKLRISLEEMNFENSREVKYSSLVEVEDRLSDLAYELGRDYVANAQTKYLKPNGDILEDTVYTDAFDNSEVVQPQNHLQTLANINILKQAFSKTLPKVVINTIGIEKIQEVQKLLKDLAFIQKQTIISTEDKKSGKDNTDCKD